MAAPWALTVLVALALAVPAVAQEFETVPLKPYDPNRPPGVDPTLDCSLLPRVGPDPLDIGLPAALAAAERRSLTLGGLGITLAWAEREPDPAYVPALKRLVEEYRCFDYDANMALLAIEAAGEPSEYFLGYARNWERDDRMAGWAMNALAVRGDSAAYGPLRRVALDAPRRGRFGRVLRNYFEGYLAGIRTWDRVLAAPVSEQLAYAMIGARKPLRSAVVRGARGDSLSQVENLGNRYISVIPRRVLRRLGRAYPTATARALVAFEDSARAELAGRGVAPEHVPLYMELVRRHGRELAFPSGAPTVPVADEADVALSVCVGATGPKLRFWSPPEGVPVARFSYRSGEAAPFRVPYGPGNELVGAGGPLLPFAPVPPEVFFPDVDERTLGRAFAVPLDEGTVTWTLLGRSVAAGEASPRCDGTDPLLLDALPAALVATGGPAAFRGTAFAVSGRPHDATGVPTAGPPVPAVVAPTDDALAAVLSALSARQRARLDGAAVTQPLVFTPASWADHLTARADVTLGARPASVGTMSAPVVAYAPDGVRLTGRFEGVGVLVADGPVEMRGNARWTGLIVARGGLNVSGSASVVGGVVVTDGLSVAGSSAVLFSPDALALARAAALAD